MYDRVAVLVLLLAVGSDSVSPLEARVRNKPRLSFVSGRHTIELSSQMIVAIRRFDTSFKLWSDEDYLPSIHSYYRYTDRQSPFAVLGDVNGDGRIDAILDGLTDSHSVLIAVLSKAGRYRVQVIHSWDLANPRSNRYSPDSSLEHGKDSFLAYCRPRRITSPYEKAPLTLRNDAFVLIHAERASSVYYYRKGRFRTFTTSD